MQESQDSPEGVFGNLPSARPGARSPRRGGVPEAGESAAKEPSAEPEAEERPEPVAAAAKAPSEPRQDEPVDEPEPPQPTEDPLAPQPAIQGVEDLAWAGVAVVAQAATAGIRFTSRALDAARKSIDRP